METGEDRGKQGRTGENREKQVKTVKDGGNRERPCRVSELEILDVASKDPWVGNLVNSPSFL